jgi:hypothetical protein
VPIALIWRPAFIHQLLEPQERLSIAGRIGARPLPSVSIMGPTVAGFASDVCNLFELDALMRIDHDFASGLCRQRAASSD